MTAANQPADGIARSLQSSRSTTDRSISLVLPAFNEAPVIEQAIREAHAALSSLGEDFEILVVDDGSSDGTHLIAETLAAELGCVKVIRFPQNRGYGAALRTGFAASTKNLVVFTDADCQFDLRELERHVLLSRDYDIVCGYRIDRKDPPHRKLYSHCYNMAVRTLLGTRVRDCDCALKMFRREVIQSIPTETNTFFINAEILSRARMQQASLVEVGVTHRPRLKGESTVSLRHVFPVGMALLRHWWREMLFPSRHSPAPLWPAHLQWGSFAFLLAMGIWLLLVNLSYPLVEPDETRYSQIPLTMLTSGDWITPKLDGKPYLDKPPLLYWMIACSYELFGVHETAARLPCAISSLLTVLATFLLGQRLIGSRAAWFGSLALLLSGGFILAGRFILMDGPLTMLTTVSFLSCLLALQGGQVKRGWWVLGAVSCGLGILMKGPVAPVLLFPPLIVLQVLGRQRTTIRAVDWLLFLTPVVAITIPWFLLISNSHDEFGSYFLWKHHIQRFTNAFNHREPWWFFLPVLWAAMFPVSLLLPIFTYFLFSKSSRERDCRTENFGALLLSAAWTLFFFSLSSCKLPTYILPAFPLLALGVGLMLDRCLGTAGVPSRVTAMLSTVPEWATPLIAFAGLSVLLLDLCLITGPSLRSFIEAGVAIAVLGALILTLWRLRAFKSASWAGMALLSFGAIMLTFGNFFPELARLRSIHIEASKLHDLHPNAPVVYFGHSAHSAELHLDDEQIVEIPTDAPGELLHFIESHEKTVLVAPPAVAESVLRAQFNLPASKSPQGRGYVQLLSAEQRISR